MAAFDRTGIAARLRELMDEHENGDLAAKAERLGLAEVALRMSINDISPHPTIEVLAAIVRVYGVDPTWLLTGEYNAATHRVAMEGEVDPATTLRDHIHKRSVRISEPTRERFGHNEAN